MGSEAVLKKDSNGVYDEALHERFMLWKDQGGKSISVLATMLGRSTAAVSQYSNKVYKGNVPELEKDIANLLRREEDLEFVRGPRAFIRTEAARLIDEVLQYCDQKQKMGAAVAPSGTGKTETCKEYKRQNRMTIFVTADITTKSPSQVMRRIIEHVGGVGRRTSVSDFLQGLIERLKGSKRLLIVDDAHFLTWEAFELVRKLHDCAGIGVVYVGQERLYEQMKGNEAKSYLFDQIYSRVAIKRDRFKVVKKDVKEMAESMVPGLDKVCVDYLFQVAKGKGRFRKMTNLLEAAQEVNSQYGTAVGLPLLQEAERLLMGE